MSTRTPTSARTPFAPDPFASPPSARTSRSGWRDPRLALGAFLVAGSVVGGTLALDKSPTGTLVMAASEDLAPGVALSEDDLVVRRVEFNNDATAASYVSAATSVVGQVTSRQLAAGELVPAAALVSQGAAVSHVPISVEADAVPPAVTVGSPVDLYAVPEARGEGKIKAEPLLTAVRVLSIDRGQEALGPAGAVQVVLGVDETSSALLPKVLAATTRGRAVVVLRSELP